MEENDLLEIYARVEEYLESVHETDPIPELTAFNTLMNSPASLREELHKYGDILIKLQNKFAELRYNSYGCREMMVTPPDLPKVVTSTFRHRMDQYLSLFQMLEDTIRMKMKTANEVVEVLRSINSSTRLG